MIAYCFTVSNYRQNHNSGELAFVLLKNWSSILWHCYVFTVGFSSFMKTSKALVYLIILCNVTISLAQSSEKTVAPKKWYEKISIRGYAQVRYNRLLETNEKLKCEQCDRSWGENGGFFIRRGRVIISGDVSERLYIYVQPDFASNVSGSFQHALQIRGRILIWLLMLKRISFALWTTKYLMVLKICNLLKTAFRSTVPTLPIVLFLTNVIWVCFFTGLSQNP
jgi:hypothetical protein